MNSSRLEMLVVVPFLNEAEHLPTLLASIDAQERQPDHLLLVDDGSTDGSAEIAERFADARGNVELLRRPPRPAERDRMVRAHVWSAFTWAIARADRPYDIVGKLDADLQLNPVLLAEIERRFAADPALGMAGVYLAERGHRGQLVRMPCPPHHVEGACRFYRRACLEAISPVPALIGWDTIDEVRARMRGYETGSFALPGGDPIHLRRTGSYDGILRGYRRKGRAAWSYGAHPLHMLGSVAVRMIDRPRGACSVAYLAGYASAALHGVPRAEPETRAFLRREQRARLLARARSGARA
jgi:glycosyltransferase involved in cell wall biosynthesis